MFVSKINRREAHMVISLGILPKVSKQTKDELQESLQRSI